MATYVWDAATGKEVRRFEGYAGVGDEILSPDGRLVLTVNSADHSALRLWDLTTGKRVQDFKIFPPRMGAQVWITAVAFSPDGRFVLASSRSDTTVYLWEVATGREVRRFAEHNGSINGVAFSPDGRFVLTLEGQRKGAALSLIIHFWDVATGREVRRLEEAITGIIENAIVASSERFIVVESSVDEPWATRLRLLDLATGHEVQRIESVAANVAFAAFSPDGRLAVTGGYNEDLRLWDMTSGQVAQRFPERVDSTGPVAFSPDSRFIVTVGYKDHKEPLDARLNEPGRWVKENLGLPTEPPLVFHRNNFARLWDVATGREVRRFIGHTDEVVCVAFSPDGRFVVTGSKDDTTRLWETATGRELRRFLHAPAGTVAFSPDGRFVLTTGFGKVRLWDAASGNEVWSVWSKWGEKPEETFGYFEMFSPDGRFVMMRWGRVVYLLDVTTGRQVRRFEHPSYVSVLGFLPDGRFVLRNESTAAIEFWDLTTEQEMRSFRGTTSTNISPDGRFIFMRRGGTTRLWEIATGQDLCQLISFRDGTWVVVDREGRFDSNNLDNNRGLHWLMPDDPLTPLPLEIFMRDYYEPRLLPRILAGEQFRPVRALQDLNRVQPVVKITTIEAQANTPDTVAVTVEVAKAAREFQRDGKKVKVETGVHDLRLFRNGQLVGYAPENEGEVALDSKTGTATRTFAVKLARTVDKKEVEFSAYAFNVDRVKSATTRRTFTPPDGLKPVKGRAYLITVGVNAYDNPAWDLQFAANDSRRIERTLRERLVGTRDYAEVISIPLISDHERRNGERVVTENRATKRNIQTVLALLAGKTVDTEHVRAIPDAGKISPVRPEDLVLLSISSHGYADASGNFYFFLADIGEGEGRQITADLLHHALSSEELSRWLRDVDGGELVLIVDACHAAATVEGEGFKPGPMGSRGLGQLAYDKGMRVLTASQADNVALESNLLQQGLLTYALIHDGLEAYQADDQPRDHIITLSEWLKYGVKRVPALYEEVKTGQIQSFARGEGSRGVVVLYTDQDDNSLKKSPALQQPALFDFTKHARATVLVREAENLKRTESSPKKTASP
jgi:WD40 repeat protein